MGERPTMRPEIDELEDRLVRRLAKIKGTSPDELRKAARRRALAIEVESMRRDR